MFGFLRRIGSRLVGLFKRKAKESVDELIEEVIDEVIEGAKEHFDGTDLYGDYTIEGYADGVPRRRYANGSLHVGKKVIQPGRR